MRGNAIFFIRLPLSTNSDTHLPTVSENMLQHSVPAIRYNA